MEKESFVEKLDKFRNAKDTVDMRSDLVGMHDYNTKTFISFDKTKAYDMSCCNNIKFKVVTDNNGLVKRQIHLDIEVFDSEFLEELINYNEYSYVEFYILNQIRNFDGIDKVLGRTAIVKIKDFTEEHTFNNVINLKVILEYDVMLFNTVDFTKVDTTGNVNVNFEIKTINSGKPEYAKINNIKAIKFNAE